MTCAIVVMGVSGSGKSTLGRALAQALGVAFVEGDCLHPAANIAKMSAAIALEDADRMPFLQSVSRVLATHSPPGVVVSCSALKRSYRDFIRERVHPVIFVLPVLNREILLERLGGRHDHFMPVKLLDSQLHDLEPPQADEQVIRTEGAASATTQVSQVLEALAARRERT